MTIHEINSLQIPILAYMVIKKDIPKSLTTFFILTKMIHFYNNRAKLNLQVSFAKSNTRKFSPAVRGPVVWNAIPYKIKGSPSRNFFKRKFSKLSYRENRLS